MAKVKNFQVFNGLKINLLA